MLGVYNFVVSCTPYIESARHKKHRQNNLFKKKERKTPNEKRTNERKKTQNKRKTENKNKFSPKIK